MPIVAGIILFCSLFFPKSVFAANIVINEFSSASSPEWVELYNTSDQETSLKDVVIFFDENPATSQKLIFCANDKISAKSYKRIDPISSSSWLSNTGDTLILKQGDDIIDSVSYGTGKTLKAPLATQSGVRSPDGTSNWILAVPTPQGDVSNFSCSQPVDPAPSPKIEWNLEDKIYVGRDFKTTKLELSNFDGNTEYYLKLRAGTEEGKLTKIQTKNSSAYLSDGESWSKFPLIKTDENSKWTGEIKGLLPEGKLEGKYKILLRIRKKDTESFYESDMKEIDFSKVPEEIIVIATPAAVVKSVEKAATKTAVISVKKSTQSAILGSSVSAEILPKQEKNNPQKANPVAVVLGVSGFFLLLFSVWGIIIKRYGS